MLEYEIFIPALLNIHQNPPKTEICIYSDV